MRFQKWLNFHRDLAHPCKPAGLLALLGALCTTSVAHHRAAEEDGQQDNTIERSSSFPSLLPACEGSHRSYMYTLQCRSWGEERGGEGGHKRTFYIYFYIEDIL